MKTPPPTLFSNNYWGYPYQLAPLVMHPHQVCNPQHHGAINMASVIASARTSTASVFDIVTQSTGLIADTISSASKGMDIIHTKVEIMHAAATQNKQQKMQLAKEADLELIVIDHAEKMADLGKRLERNAEIKRIYTETMAKFEQN